MSLRMPFNGTFPVTQEFGNKLYITDVNSPLFEQGREDFYGRYGMFGHNGKDYGLPLETQVVAPFTGTVIEARYDQGYGNYIKLEDDTQGSTLAHLNSVAVKVGDKVEEGQVIGYSGSTGNSTGPHLHWGYYQVPRNRGNGYDGYIDQTAFVNLPAVGGAEIPAAVNTPTYTQEEYQACMNDRENFWKERDAYMGEAKHLAEEVANQSMRINELERDVEAEKQSYRLLEQAKDVQIKELTVKLNELSSNLAKPNLPTIPVEEYNVLSTQVTELKGQLLEKESELSRLQQDYADTSTKLSVCQTDYQTYRDSIETNPLEREVLPLGALTAEEADKLIKERDGVMTELTQVLKAKEDLAKLLAKKDKEDYTAIMIGLNYMAKKAAKSRGVKSFFKMLGEDLYSFITKQEFKN